MKRLGRPITHRQVELQFGLDFPTYDEKIMNHGGIEDQFKQPLKYQFENELDRPEWSLQQTRNLR